MKAPAKKRGPGRPRLSADDETVPLTIRITERHFEELRRVMEESGLPTLAHAVRVLVEASAAFRAADRAAERKRKK